MANFAKTVAILFQGDDSGASAAARRVSEALDGVDAAAKRSTTSGNLWQDSAGRWRNELGQFATNAEKAAAGIKTFDGNARSAASSSSLLADAIKLIGAGVIFKAFVDANVEVERFTRGVTAITGSGESATRELQYLRDVSERLGLSVRDTSSAYVGFLASVKGTSLEGAQARQVFEAVVGAMSALGKSSADTEGALTAIQQIISKGKVSAEELRGQLGERLPGAFQIAARAIGVTTSELDKMLEQGQVISTDFLPKFAAELERTFDNPGRVEGYTAALNRLQNQFDETLQTIGRSGLFDALTSGLVVVGKLTEAAGSTFDYFGTAARAAFNVLRGGSTEVFSEEMRLAEQRVAAVSAKLNGDLNQTLAETARLLRQNAEVAKGAFPDETTAETQRLTRAANLLTDQLKAESEALKVLKVNREEVNRSTKDYAQLIEQIGRSQGVTDREFLAGVAEAAKRVDGTKASFEALRSAISDGAIEGNRGADTLAKAFKIVEDASLKAAKGTDASAEALKKQAEEAQRAKERAEQLRLEMEKLASNERIKVLELRAQLDITNVQEQTKRIQAAFESLDNTVNSTADVINKAFGLLAGGGDFLDSSTRNKLFEQLDIENANRERALRQQEELTQAQIKVLRAQAEQLTRGDALIKIDGAGLAPHLEAFMWEVLKAIQVRVNRDGLKLLLGV